MAVWKRNGHSAFVASSSLAALANDADVGSTEKRWTGRVRESIVEVVSRYLIAAAALYFVYTAFEKFWK